MKTTNLLFAGLILASAWSSPAVAQPAAAPATPAPAAPLTPAQLTAVMTMNVGVAPLNQRVTAAAAALAAATFAQPANPADISAKVDALANAELALARARADGIGQIQAGANHMTAAQLQTMSQPGGRGGRAGVNTAIGLPPTITPGTVVEKLAALPRETYTVGMPFTEGATRAPNGDVFFVEQNSDKIMRWSVADKALSVFMHPSGFANGMTFDYQGRLIVCADERNELWSVDIARTETIPFPAPLNPAVGDPNRPATLTRPAVTVLVNGQYNGKLLGGPNDVWARPDGGLYITDPYYARSWWTPGRQSEQDIRTVYFVSADRKTFKRVLSDFNGVNGAAGTPNGIAGTSDGKTLFVANITGGETYGYDIQPDGSLTNKRVVCTFGSDGMTLDNQGNLYMSAGGGVNVVSTKTGQQIGFIPVPEGPANMCFGGVDRSTLYITARTGFYAIPTNVKGENPGK